MSNHSQIASSTATDSGLPDFAQPPVDETAISLQFPPIRGFNVPHFGLYWNRVRQDFDRFEIQQPITNLIETFGPPVKKRRPSIEMLELPEIRCWILDHTGNRLVQVQRDRFVHNWRKVVGNETYPRYPILRESLLKEWTRFCEFLRDEGLAPPEVNQCEVTYVNNIECNKGWNGYGELDKVIATLATPKANTFLPGPERVNMQAIYRLPDDAGRLYIAFVPMIRGRDGVEVLQMTLTARGAPKSPSVEDVFSWIDLGRKWVVRGFADFTTPEMHSVWEKQ